MKKIFIIRHGESIANALGKHQGQRIDTSLSEKGIEQAKKIARRLKEEKIDIIYSSDLKRAKETAEEINRFHKKELRLDKRLREYDLGDFTDTKNAWTEFNDYREIEAKKQGIEKYKVSPPNGESDLDHIERVKEFLEELIQTKWKNLAIVAHGVTNKIFFGLINHCSKSEMYKLKQNNCCLNEIEFDDKEWKVNKINCILHLEV
jgi:phosphoserine phosphatase